MLVLGCGDIRSCFYTLWKNFNDSSAPSRFEGVRFVLNDISAAVLARNILFLHLCLQMPKDEEGIKKWLCATWAIWYCHELYPQHEEVLNDSLRLLCKHSSSWDNDSNPLYPMIQFSSSSTLNEVASVWKMWLFKETNIRSVQEMHSSRVKIKKEHNKYSSSELEKEALDFMARDKVINFMVDDPTHKKIRMCFLL